MVANALPRSRSAGIEVPSPDGDPVTTAEQPPPEGDKQPHKPHLSIHPRTAPTHHPLIEPRRRRATPNPQTSETLALQAE